MNDEDKKKLIKECLSKGLLFSPELGQKSEEKENIFYFENTKKINLSIQENKESAEIENTEEFLNKDVEILTSYGEKWKKKTIKDFFNHYSSRFKTLSQMLRRREELKGATAIKRISLRNQNESVATIGMVKSKRITKNDHILLVIEDLTGETSVLISKNKNTKEEGKDKSLYEEAKDICLDEVIGVLGNKGESDIIFASGLVWPDLPRGMEFKKSPVEEYAVFIGDTHFGSKHFLHKEFNLFLNWITGKIGSPAQKEMAKKIKYLFLVGDLIEGAGIYPNQEDDLEVKDIYKQYEIFSSFLKIFELSFFINLN